MAKQWGATCGPNNQCWGGEPYEWCEAFPNGCQRGGVGDRRIKEKRAALSSKDFQATMDASQTKFFGTWTDAGGLLLEEVGMLAAAGLQPGDVLTGAFTVGGKTLDMADPDDRKKILTWQFKSDLVNLIYERNNTSLTRTMKNPKDTI